MPSTLQKKSVQPSPLVSPTVVVRWNQVALEAIRQTHPGPPMVARIVAILHTAMYDAWAAYEGKLCATLGPSAPTAGTTASGAPFPE